MFMSAFLKYSPGRIRVHLFRDLMLVVLFAVATLVAVNYLLISEVRRELAWGQISQSMVRVRDEVRRLLEPVEQQLAILRDLGRTGELDRGDVSRLTAQMLPTLTHLPQLSSLIIVDDSGAEYFLQRDGAQWLVRERMAGDSGRVTWRRWGSGGGELESWDETLSYDPRQRPWFEEALGKASSAEISWSRPYLFFSRQVPGVTASAAWRDGEKTFVVALDVELTTILETIDSLSLDEDGKGFLFRSDGGVYVPPVGQTDRLLPGAAENFFSASSSHGGTLSIDAVAAWQRQGAPDDKPIQFTSGERLWWGGFMALYADDEAAWLGVALPLGDLLTVLQRRWQLVLIAALAVLGMALLLIVLLVRKYSGQIKELPRLSIERKRYQEDIRSLIHSGESMHLEFKSTMRMNLRSGKPGKEIELAWLKGAAAFMNTEGGILLIGVEDDGTVLGIEADGFENEDKCRLHFKNLFNQHLGPELSKYVRLEIYRLEEREVVAIECERAGEPVFLVHKQGESFYIRNGPSNIELTISQALSYLRRRF